MKLLLLDKDGTLTKPRSGGDFVQNPKDQELLPGVEKAIARYVADGWVIAIVSNQGGVAAGHKTLEDAIAEMRFCMNLLPEITCAWFCPDFDGKVAYRIDCNGKQRKYNSSLRSDSSYRKPSPGMLEIAEVWFNVKHENILMVGDRPEDEGAAIAAGVKLLWAEDWRQA